MNINYELYRVFCAVAKNKNITKAAIELMISQPAVSKSIKSLEEQLGTKLFIRNKKGVVLTEEGTLFYNNIKNGLDIIIDAEKKLKQVLDLEDGEINIGASKTITEAYLLPYIKEFHEKYPNIKINIHTSITNELIKKARNGLVDFIILHLPYTIPNDFTKRNLLKIHDGFFANKDYIELKDKTINIKDLNNYPLILLAHGSNTRYFLEEYLTNNNTCLKPNMELESTFLVNDFIKVGLGIGFTTKEYIKDSLKNGELFEIKVEPQIGNRYIGITYLKEQSLRQCAKEFIKLLEKH